MDLFDPPEVAQNANSERKLYDKYELQNRDPSEWDCLEWEPDQPEPPPEDEIEAQMCGSERAGIPSMSMSAERLRARWRAFLDASDPSRRDLLVSIEAEYYQAARRRKLARLAMEAADPQF